VDQRHLVAVVLDGVVDGLADEALAPLLGDGFEAEADGTLVHHAVEVHLVLDEVSYLLGLLGAGLPLDAGVDVLGVLPERDHVHLLGRLHR